MVDLQPGSLTHLSYQSSCLYFYRLGQHVNYAEFNWGCHISLYLSKHECRAFHGQLTRGISTPPFHYFDMVLSVLGFTCGCFRFVELALAGILMQFEISNFDIFQKSDCPSRLILTCSIWIPLYHIFLFLDRSYVLGDNNRSSQSAPFCSSFSPITCSWGFGILTNRAIGWKLPEMPVWQGNASGGKRAEDSGRMALYFAATGLRIGKQEPLLPPRSPLSLSGAVIVLDLVALLSIFSYEFYHISSFEVPFIWGCNHPWFLPASVQVSWLPR